MKIKRDEVKTLFNERARALAHDSAVEGQLLVDWAD